jgi:HlyD family secretion protein
VKKWIFGSLIVLGLAVGLYWLFTHKPAVASLPPRTQAVDIGDLAEKVSVTARTIPAHYYHVGPDLLPAGRVLWLNPKAELGDVVIADDELIRLDDEYAKAQLEQAKAKKDAAESNVKKAEGAQERAQAAWDRTESSRKTAQSAVDAAQKFLDTIRANDKKDKEQEAKDKEKEPDTSRPTTGLESGAIEKLKLAKESLASYEAGIKEAKAAIKEADGAKQAADGLVKEAEQGIVVAQRALKSYSIKAPAGGTIVKKEVVLGQIVSPQATPTLFIIADLSKMQVVAAVNESDIARIRLGMDVRFKIDAYADEVPEFEGKVTRIAKVPLTTPLGSGGQKIDPAAVLNAPVVFPVVIDVVPLKDKPNFELKAGLTANVDFVLRKAEGKLRIPSDALGYKPDQLTAEEEKALNERIESPWKPIWLHQNGQHRQLIFVQTGISSDGKTEITKVDGKLEPGMQVIIESPPAATNGGFKLPFKL